MNPREPRPAARRRAIDGVLLLDKPAGITSYAAVRQAQRLFNAAKAGHTGTLDPLATGLLPVCFGEATKFSHLLLEADKTYLAVLRLGVTTATGDLEGEVTSEKPVAVSKSEAEAVLSQFRGEILQTPPMYSAIKKDGQPLYKLARAGRELARAPRKVRITGLTLSGWEPPQFTVSVTGSKGTYIRVLAEDIGRALGCGACLAGLRRTAVGGFMLSSGTVSFAELEALEPEQREALLLPTDALVAILPRCDLDAERAQRLRRGQTVAAAAAGPPGLARIYGPDREFLGVAEITAPGRIVPRRMRSQSAAAPAHKGVLLEKTRG